MATLKEQLYGLAENIITENGFYFVDFQLKGTTNQQKLVFLIDSDQGVTVQDCTKISRLAEALLEQTNMLPGAYVLEVSSPGLDTPLRHAWQYRKNVGRELKIVLLDGMEKKGLLLSVSETGILLKETIKKKDKNKLIPSEGTEIPFDAIKESKVLVSFK